MGRLAGSFALITGAASGIGAATAVRFAAEGACVAGFDVNDPSDSVRRACEAANPKSCFFKVNITDETAVQRDVEAVREKFGRIDALVNAAGVAGGGPVHLLAQEEWDRVIDTNLKGTYLVTKHVLAAMIEQHSGSIVNIASIEGIEGVEAASAYNASKGGVVLLTRNLAIDYGRSGIRANCICPGFIDTPMLAILDQPSFAEVRERFRDMHMLGRFGRPEEIAAVALFLVSEDASFVTGHALIADGGFTAGRRMGMITGF